MGTQTSARTIGKKQTTGQLGRFCWVKLPLVLTQPARMSKKAVGELGNWGWPFQSFRITIGSLASQKTREGFEYGWELEGIIFCWCFSLCPTHMTKHQIDESRLQKNNPNDPSVNQSSTHEGTLNEVWYSHMMAPVSYIKCYRPDMWDIYMRNINNSYIINLQMKNGRPLVKSYCYMMIP